MLDEHAANLRHGAAEAAVVGAGEEEGGVDGSEVEAELLRQRARFGEHLRFDIFEGDIFRLIPSHVDGHMRGGPGQLVHEGGVLELLLEGPGRARRHVVPESPSPEFAEDPGGHLDVERLDPVLNPVNVHADLAEFIAQDAIPLLHARFGWCWHLWPP